jgi:hypothetical protein
MSEQFSVLSFNTRKALCVQLGESAGREIADLLVRLANRLDTVERGKVDVISIAPGRPIQAARPMPSIADSL